MRADPRAGTWPRRCALAHYVEVTGYEPVAVRAELAAHIEGIWMQTAASAPVYRVAPGPFPVAGFQWRGGLGVVRENGTQPLARAGLTGLQAQARRFAASADTLSVLVRFRPQGAYGLLGIPMHELAGQHVGFASLIGSAEAREAMDQVEQAPSIGAAAEAVQGLLLRLMGRCGRGPHPAVSAAVEVLLHSRGGARLHRLEQATGYSARQLQRLFLQQVGVGPQALATLARFAAALRAARPGLGSAALALESGYADQAHMIRDFHARMGTPPGQDVAFVQALATSRGSS